MPRLLFYGICILIILSIIRRVWKLFLVVFRIDVTQNDFLVRGKIPRRYNLELRTFLNKLNLPDNSSILAFRNGNFFRLKFSRNIHPDKQQKIRNFFFNIM